MPLIELISFRVAPLGSGSGLSGVDLALEKGEMVAVDADEPDDGRLLLRALATLSPPAAGELRFKGAPLDFADYRRLLPVKRSIGYVGADMAMLSNRTLRQNILTMRYYFENSLSIDLDAEAADLCRRLGIEKRLDRLAALADPVDLHRAIAVRELSKNPVLMLLDRPEEILGRQGFQHLLTTLETSGKQRQTWVCTSRDRRFLETLCNRRLRIRNGAVTTEILAKTH
jgi:ABC-type lipoprotein export system ATPase subunit